jgi:hypothetical protein
MSDNKPLTEEEIALNSLDQSIAEINAMANISAPAPLPTPASTPILPAEPNVIPSATPNVIPDVVSDVVSDVTPPATQTVETIQSSFLEKADSVIENTVAEAMSKTSEIIEPVKNTPVSPELQNDSSLDSSLEALKTDLEKSLVEEFTPTEPLSKTLDGGPQPPDEDVEVFSSLREKPTEMVSKGLEFFTVFNSPLSVFVAGAIYLAVGSWLSSFMGYDTYQDRWSLTSLSIILGWIIPILLVLLITYLIFMLVYAIVSKINDFVINFKQNREEKKRKKLEKEEARLAALRMAREKENSEQRKLREQLEKIQEQEANIKKQLQEKEGGVLNSTINTLMDKFNRRD